MSARRRKWRPPLSLLIAAFVAVLIALPAFGMATVVALTRPPDELLDSLARNGWQIASALVVIVAAAALTAWVFWRGLAGPLRELVRRADAVARGEPEFSTAGPHGTREVAALAHSFAAVVDRLGRRSRYLETLSAHLAHELRSPLTSIRGGAELMRDEPDMDAGTRARFLANIEEDADKLTTLAARLRELARADMMAVTGGETTMRAITSALEGRGVAIQTSGAASVPLPPEPVLIALGHLADNARRHGARTLDLAVDADGLTVGNDGAPITDSPERPFEPFYTTARAEGGTGLGLAIARAILASGGATIRLATTDPVAFRIEWCQERPRPEATH